MSQMRYDTRLRSSFFTCTKMRLALSMLSNKACRCLLDPMCAHGLIALEVAKEVMACVAQVSWA